MEKLIYLLWKPNASDRAAWHESLRQTTLAVLRQEAATRIRLNLVDDEVAPADSMRLPLAGAPLADALLSFWLPSASQRAAIQSHLMGLSACVAGYSVLESEPLPNKLHPPAVGERCYGMNHVVFLQVPPRLTRVEWLSTWLELHTPIAIDTQQTFGYRQNVVLRALTPDAPAIDAIVEENFPPAAMTDQNAFYRRDTEEQLKDNQQRMFRSCKRFIDFDKMARLPTSEYNFN